MVSAMSLLRHICFISIGFWISCVQCTSSSEEGIGTDGSFLRSTLCAEPLWNPLIDLTGYAQNISDMLLKVMSNPASVYCGIALIIPDLVGNVSGLSSNGQVTGDSADVMNSSGLQDDVEDGSEFRNASQGEGQPDDFNSPPEVNRYEQMLTGVSLTCGRQMALAVHGMISGLPWARKLLDSIAKPESGLLEGRTTWLGSFEECSQVKAVAGGNNATLEHRYQPFNGQYCSVHLFLPIQNPTFPTLSGLVFGLCVPDGCNDDDISGLLRAAVGSNSMSGVQPGGVAGCLYVSPDLVAAIQHGDGEFKPTVSCQLKDLPLDTTAIAVICVLSVLGMLMLCGTMYDVVVIQRDVVDRSHGSSNTSASGLTNHTFESHEENDKGVAEGTVNGPPMVNTLQWLDDQHSQRSSSCQDNSQEESLPPVIITQTEENRFSPAIIPATTSNDRTRSRFERALLGFSVYTNVLKLMNTSQSSEGLPSLHGIRVFSMGWIVLAHTYVFVPVASDSLWIHIEKVLQDWSHMVLFYSTVAVDAFFTLSGLLVAYLTLREMKRVGGIRRFNWLMFYIHRFWRLTPPYMLLIMTYVGIHRYISNGPLWEQSADGVYLSNCKKNWWTNLLFINNLVNVDEPCLGWSWYLANDMQFYVLSPFLLIPLFHSAVPGLIACFLFLAASTITPGLISKAHGFSAQSFEVSAHQVGEDLNYRSALYYPPYTRMGPYIIGLITGYVLYRTNCKCRIPKMLNLAGWLLTAGILTSVVYGLYGVDGQHVLNEDESSFYHALARSGWGMAVSWVVFACSTGHGGVVNRLLSWGALIPLSRLTYCAYLLHPLVILTYYQSRRTLINVTDYTSAYLFIGHVVTSYGTAFCMSLAFESPMIGLEKVVFRPNRKS